MFEFITTYIYPIIITALFSTGLVASLFYNIKMKIEKNKLYVKHIHGKTFKIKSMEKALENAVAIKQIAYMPDVFCDTHVDVLGQRYENGCDIRVLVSGDEDFLNAAVSCQRKIVKQSDDVQETYDYYTKKLLLLVKQISKCTDTSHTHGRIEVRKYSKEFRNSATIITDNKGDKREYINVILTQKKSGECITIESEKSKTLGAEDYFDVVWQRHQTDVLYST